MSSTTDPTEPTPLPGLVVRAAAFPALPGHPRRHFPSAQQLDAMMEV